MDAMFPWIINHLTDVLQFVPTEERASLSSAFNLPTMQHFYLFSFVHWHPCAHQIQHPLSFLWWGWNICKLTWFKVQLNMIKCKTKCSVHLISIPTLLRTLGRQCDLLTSPPFIVNSEFHHRLFSQYSHRIDRPRDLISNCDLVNSRVSCSLHQRKSHWRQHTWNFTVFHHLWPFGTDNVCISSVPPHIFRQQQEPEAFINVLMPWKL